MVVLRSLAFAVVFYGWTIVLAIVCLPALLVSREAVQACARFWTGGLVWLAKAVCGVRYRVIGREHLPKGPCIVASKHQSAWDTFFFHRILPDPVYVMKRELLSVPVLGWYFRNGGSVAIDRSARFRALKMLVEDAARALAAGSQIIVFPEGTRVAPGTVLPYHAGVAALYEKCAVPVVPVALNSGRLWGRRSFLKYPGEISVEILEPIPPGFARREFLDELRDRIETASERLAAAESLVDKPPTE